MGFNESETKTVKKEFISRNKTKILIEGGFATGKNTLISAMLKRKIFPTFDFLPAILKITFSKGDEKVAIYYECKTQLHKEVEIMSVDEFNEIKRCEEMLSDVRFIEVTFSEPEFLYNTELYTSTIDDNNWIELVNMCDMIVHTLSATKGLTRSEKDFLKMHFGNRHLKNVFFVYTQYEAVQFLYEEEFENYVKSMLYDIFIDEDGNFDEKLYKERVFFVNAFGANCARTGQAYYNSSGGKNTETPISEEETGIPEFEKALMEYIKWQA